MSLSIYKFIAYYISKGKLAQVVSGWTPKLLVWGSNPLGSKQMGGHCSGTVAHWLYCSAFDFRWPTLTMQYIGKNRRFIAKIRAISRESLIFRDLSWNIVGPIFLHEISCRYSSIRGGGRHYSYVGRGCWDVCALCNSLGHWAFQCPFCLQKLHSSKLTCVGDLVWLLEKGLLGTARTDGLDAGEGPFLPES